ncbi:3-deoxy-D-arabinoheptulosonate-7-phosphate synthase [Leptolyngbya sp. PCC 7375]|nr:3-deoxy-D-arabinoheptulosonate-7-phosphate synthase [Leptolyngbya sp. PCC 7375]
MKDAKLVAKSRANHISEIEIAPALTGPASPITVGGKDLFIVGGPCAIESMAQMEAIAQAQLPIQGLRGGIYKPRTSPYSFQGLGDVGLDILSAIRKRYGLPVITEVMAIHQIEKLAPHADVLQIGSRNMQNFDLLKALGEVNKPVLLKRGLAATVSEFVMAAEYIASHGNPNIILCERGIRSFDSHTRNVLDLGAVVALKQLTHLPVLVDPSHATGKRELVAPLARAAIAAGADGLIIECHPDPDQSVSDARQTISLEAMADLVDSLGPIAQAVGRAVKPSSSLKLVA